MKASLLRNLGPVTVVFIASTAFAHPMKGVGDFYAGMLHPVTSIDAILPLIALGLFAGQQQRETAIKMLAAFPASVVLGTLLIFLRPTPSSIGIYELGLTAIFGLLIAFAKPIPSAVGMTAAILLGLSLGWSNAAEITPDISCVRFVAGLALVGLLLATYGVGLVRRLKFEWSQIAVRVVGSWLAAVGILVLSLR